MSFDSTGLYNRDYYSSLLVCLSVYYAYYTL